VRRRALDQIVIGGFSQGNESRKIARDIVGGGALCAKALYILSAAACASAYATRDHYPVFAIERRDADLTAVAALANTLKEWGLAWPTASWSSRLRPCIDGCCDRRSPSQQSRQQRPRAIANASMHPIGPAPWPPR
jgi:hypothetical protein